jgi:gluconokinase
MSSPGHPILVMGVSGSGKSTVGALLAERLELAFLDADSLHPASNVAKMAHGEPLTDEDRGPWLASVGAWLAEARGVVACSALRRPYRDVLRGHCADLVVFYLEASRALLEQRLTGRSGHFMPASLLDSQLATLEPLEPDERGVTLSAALSPAELVDAYVRSLADKE